MTLIVLSLLFKILFQYFYYFFAHPYKLLFNFDAFVGLFAQVFFLAHSASHSPVPLQNSSSKYFEN